MAVDKKSMAQVEEETRQEVDQLIQELKADPDVAGFDASTEPAGPQGIQDFHASSEDEGMEDTLAQLKPEEGAADEGQFANRGASASNGELLMTLKAEVNLVLQFEVNGQEIRIGFKDQHLQVEMADGTEFRVPLRRSPVKLVS